MTDPAAGLSPVLVTLAAVLGLAVGSFLNVVIWRVPRGESVVRPPSACPACRHPIRPRDNVPVVSWLLLRARCRDCAAPISGRYPAVELACAVLFGLVAWRVGLDWRLPALLYLAAIGLALALIDLDVNRLPDAIVLPSYPVAAILLVVAGLGTGEPFALVRALIGGAAMLAFYGLLAVVWPGGMGWGDVKLAGLLGLYLGFAGWGALAVGAFGAFLLGGLFSVVLLVARRAGRRTRVPFGPWMIVGAALGLAWGEALWDAYLGLML